jgi:4-amino-4-deoxy-L-arabinose transferase-like glycosyltransferase
MAAAVRGYLLWQYYCITWDGVEYIRAAKKFFTGNVSAGLQSVYPPGYPLLIAAAHPLIGDWELAGQCVSIVCGILLLLPLYWIFNQMFDGKIALLACYLAAINPFLALYSVHVRSESPYLLLSATAFYLLFIAIERRAMARFFAAGLIAGYAFLIRPEAIGFLLIVPGVLLLRWWCWREQSGVALLQPVGALTAGFVIFALPYIAYLSVDTGRVGAISRKAGVTLAINLQESGLLDAEGHGRESDVSEFVFTDYVLRNPLSYLKKVTSDLPAAVWTFFQALYYSYLPFLLLGLFVALRKDFFHRSHLLLAGFVLFYVFGFALILVKRRYALQAVPLSLAWVALGMVCLWDWLRARLSFQTAKLTLALIALLFVASTLARTLKPVSREKAFVRQAGWYLKERNLNGDLAVAAFDERPAFYAAARSILLSPQMDPGNLSGFLRDQKADYFAAESKTFAKFLPAVSRQPESYGLVLEEQFVGTRNDRMLVFKVN